jgi:uncharacterized short protein YbdD (DUF466 family)
MSTTLTAVRSAGGVLRTAGGAIARGLGHLHWYLKEIMGENAYLHYLESYRRRHGTDEGAMGKREFWKDLTDAQDRNPKARCCCGAERRRRPHRAVGPPPSCRLRPVPAGRSR